MSRTFFLFIPTGDLFKMDKPTKKYAPYVLHYTAYDGKAGSAGKRETIQVDAVIGADESNSRAAKSIDAGDYEYAIAFQERIKIPEDKMQYYEDLAAMYVGNDVSPYFYGWVFPKCDHVAVGTVTHKPDIKKFQLATRLRSRDKILGGTNAYLHLSASPFRTFPRFSPPPPPPSLSIDVRLHLHRW